MRLLRTDQIIRDLGRLERPVGSVLAGAAAVLPADRAELAGLAPALQAPFEVAGTLVRRGELHVDSASVG
jgi:hypothetical protein